ncbi:uncharacterized protein [Solanum tuberosum]|uniref:uncharacterized protein n=1 Tax=Solanum tuberosum TaxID=4113 RepID=UPI00073A4815|nr:PREDICTED: uncharacterized protein LOC107058465 [Solanum tuberosum]
MVWTKQRMSIAGQVMRIQAWNPNFTPTAETPVVPVWISLPELPWHCYNKEFVSGLLSPIGKVLYFDSASIKKTRGSQARVKVQIDLTQKRPSFIWMGYIGEDITDGRWQKIEYDNIPDYCFYCNHQGHLENKNPQQPKGHKVVEQKEDINQQYKQHRDQEQIQHQQEDHWQIQRRKNNNQMQAPRGNNSQADQSTKWAGNNKGKEVLKGQAVIGIDSMLPSPVPTDNVVTIIAEEVVGGVDGKGQETQTNLQEGVSKKGEELTHVIHEEVAFDHRQHQSRLNNKSGDRLSKKKREAIKKRLQQSAGQESDGTATGKQTEAQASYKSQNPLNTNQHGDEQAPNIINKGKLTLDDYRAINSDDEFDPDNQSIDESDEDTEDNMQHTDNSHIDMVKIQLQMDHAASNPNGKIWLFWSNEVTGSILEKHEQHITVTFKYTDIHDKFMMSFIYAKCKDYMRRPLWDRLLVYSNMEIPWCTIGDFNVITSIEEKSGGIPYNIHKSFEFIGMIEACGLVDIGYTGLPFTWCNQRDAEARVWKRLDRAMVNDKWLEVMPQTTIENLSSVGSDHTPMLMEMIRANARH